MSRNGPAVIEDLRAKRGQGPQTLTDEDAAALVAAWDGLVNESKACKQLADQREASYRSAQLSANRQSERAELLAQVAEALLQYVTAG